MADKKDAAQEQNDAAAERVAALTQPLKPKDDPTFHVEKFYDPKTGKEIEPEWREHDIK